MKGITEIELTDVRTGEKEKYTETNLVTNAIADFFSHNMAAFCCFPIPSRKIQTAIMHRLTIPVSVMRPTMSMPPPISCVAV